MQTEFNIITEFNKEGLYRQYLKRPMDVLLSFSSLIVLSPIFLIIALLVRFYLGSPVIFKQERSGLDEKIFSLYKFRTMNDKRDENHNLLPDKDRLTKLGQFLRLTSLDELPELFNILIGDMSLIGPRPLLIEYLPLYNEYQKRRHEVRPGLSGLAQVKGRNLLGWEDRFNLDVDYVDRVSFCLDVKIISLTILRVLKREGVNVHGSVTVSKFLGNSDSESGLSNKSSK